MITVVFESEIDIEHGSLSWEQGLALLLSSSDVEPVQAVFMLDSGSLGQLPLKLGKKLQQLELYEVASFCLEQEASTKALESSKASAPCGTIMAQESNGLEWSWVQSVSAEQLRQCLEQGGMIFSV